MIGSITIKVQYIISLMTDLFGLEKDLKKLFFYTFITVEIEYCSDVGKFSIKLNEVAMFCDSLLINFYLTFLKIEQLG